MLELLMVKRDILYIPANFLSNRSKDINDILCNLVLTGVSLVYLCVFIGSYVYTCIY